MLTIALPKGRLADQTLDIMEKAGYDVSAAREKSRKLILEDKDAGLRFILSKPSDVPTYVEYGAADIGVVGKDTLLEEGRQLYEVLDLGLGKCRMCVAGPAELKDKLDTYLWCICYLLDSHTRNFLTSVNLCLKLCPVRLVCIDLLVVWEDYSDIII